MLLATAAVEMVSWALAALEPGVMEAGENEQLKPVGSPLQESAMRSLKAPDCGVAMTVRFPDCPDEMVSDEGAALNETVEFPGVVLVAQVEL